MTRNDVLNKLHKKVGRCMHCYKVKCRLKKNSILPELIHIDDVIAVLKELQDAETKKG